MVTRARSETRAEKTTSPTRLRASPERFRNRCSQEFRVRTRLKRSVFKRKKISRLVRWCTTTRTSGHNTAAPVFIQTRYRMTQHLRGSSGLEVGNHPRLQSSRLNQQSRRT